jgi:hypothetical protein
MVPKLLRARGSLSYRPHLRVGRQGEWLGVAFLDGSAEWGEPGAHTECLVVLAYTSTGVDYSPLVPGAEFAVLEGHAIVGRGTVQRRLDDPADWRTSAD